MIEFVYRKYFRYFINIARKEIIFYKLYCDPQDVVHDTIYRLLINRALDKYNDEKHMFNIIANKIKYMLIDTVKSLSDKQFFELKDFDIIDDDSPSIYDNLTEDEYNKFREISCNVRQDSFYNYDDVQKNCEIQTGWISGYVHTYINKSNNKRYTYWQYAAYYYPKNKRESTPKRIKTSQNKRECYLALCEFNLSLSNK